MILLDTHVLVWLRSGDSRLGKEAIRKIDLAWQKDQMGVSASSFWELAMLTETGRIELPMHIQIWRRELLKEGLIEIPIDGEIALRSRELAGFHADPADRFIVATCLNGHSLATADRKILNWDGQLDRIDARL